MAFPFEVSAKAYRKGSANLHVLPNSRYFEGKPALSPLEQTSSIRGPLERMHACFDFSAGIGLELSRQWLGEDA